MTRYEWWEDRPGDFDQPGQLEEYGCKPKPDCDCDSVKPIIKVLCLVLLVALFVIFIITSIVATQL